MTAMLSPEMFTEFAKRDEFEGFGYLGERRHAIANGKGELVEATDRVVVEDALAAGMDAEALFTWANSKAGRWFGDCMFGAAGTHAEKYLPSVAR